jgi:hypothetical protein
MGDEIRRDWTAERSPSKVSGGPCRASEPVGGGIGASSVSGLRLGSERFFELRVICPPF